jgi:hypothetical protein
MFFRAKGIIGLNNGLAEKENQLLFEATDFNSTLMKMRRLQRHWLWVQR